METLDSFWTTIVRFSEISVFGTDLGSIGLCLAIFLAFVLTRRLFSRVLFGALDHVAERKAPKIGRMFISAAESPVGFLYVFAGLFIGLHVAGINAADVWASLFSRSLILFTIFWTLYNTIEPLSFLIDRLISLPRTSASTRETLRAFFVPLLRTVVVILGVAAILEEWGFNVGAVLGGLGLVGMALALAAKDIIANLFSGIMIFFNRMFEKGNWIQTPSVEGIVEQVGLMTTRVRQFDHALAIVENSRLTSEPITNYARMGHRRIFWNIGLEYSTTQEQLQAIVKETRDYIYGSDDFETNPKKVSTFVVIDNFAESSINMMLYCFTKTVDWGEWLQAKEALAFKIKEIIEKNGTGFAFPSTSLYVAELPFGTPEAFPAIAEDRPAAFAKKSGAS